MTATNPIKAGYGKQTVSDNIAELRASGRPKIAAVAIALNGARKSFRKRFPKMAFPHWLQLKNPAPKSMHNIERSEFKRGEYVGYADGVWRIAKGGQGWSATHRENKHPSHSARTLEEISDYLDGIKPAKANPRRKTLARKSRAVLLNPYAERFRVEIKVRGRGNTIKWVPSSRHKTKDEALRTARSIAGLTQSMTRVIDIGANNV
jgi:hypothetical protein